MLWFDDSVDRSTIPLPKFNSANSSDLGLSTVTEKKKVTLMVFCAYSLNLLSVILQHSPTDASG